MIQIAQAEQAAFRQAASAFFAMRERLELLQAQGAEKLGHKPGHVPVSAEHSATFMEPGRKLLAVLVDIMQKNPSIPAVRFRGHIFMLDVYKGRVLGLKMLREAEIPEVND